MQTSTPSRVNDPVKALIEAEEKLLTDAHLYLYLWRGIHNLHVNIDDAWYYHADTSSPDYYSSMGNRVYVGYCIAERVNGVWVQAIDHIPLTGNGLNFRHVNPEHSKVVHQRIVNRRKGLLLEEALKR